MAGTDWYEFFVTRAIGGGSDSCGVYCYDRSGKNELLRKLCLISAVAAALLLPLPVTAGGAFKGGATNAGGKYVH